MGTASLKFISSFYYSFLSGGILMNTPLVEDIIDVDRMDKGVYTIIVIITFFLWAAKYFLENVYKKKREIDREFRDKGKDEK